METIKKLRTGSKNKEALELVLNFMTHYTIKISFDETKKDVL